MKKLTQSDYNRKCQARQAAAGLVRVSVMIPAEKADFLRATAKSWRDQAENRKKLRDGLEGRNALCVHMISIDKPCQWCHPEREGK